ncbi:phage regulatory CII family protein [Rhizobium cremeum]|uniref:phage regulatory CII family protein n=1 Tax=Rhizobium cremeum TaxID=2813827 RepID=UPI0039E047A5
MRPSTEHDRARLKASTRAAIIAAGKAKQLAACSRVNEPQISRYVGGDYPDFMPLDVILDCELLAGQPVMTAALADMLGYRLVPIAGGDETSLTLDHVLDAVNAVGELLRAFRDGHSDGHLDEAERREITNCFNESMKSLQDGLRAHTGGTFR